MSASGTKRTSLVALHMSAYDPKRTSTAVIIYICFKSSVRQAPNINDQALTTKTNIEIASAAATTWMLHRQFITSNKPPSPAPKAHRIVVAIRITGDLSLFLCMIHAAENGK